MQACHVVNDEILVSASPSATLGNVIKAAVDTYDQENCDGNNFEVEIVRITMTPLGLINYYCQVKVTEYL